jgi:hypothetical protein
MNKNNNDIMPYEYQPVSLLVINLTYLKYFSIAIEKNENEIRLICFILIK